MSERKRTTAEQIAANPRMQIPSVTLPASAYEGLTPAYPGAHPVSTNAVTRAAIQAIKADDQWLPLPEGATVSEILRARNTQLAALKDTLPATYEGTTREDRPRLDE